MPRVKNYVNNKDLTAAVMAYQAVCNEAEATGNPVPNIPNYIGECILQICNRLTKGFGFDFTGHSYRDEMIADAIEGCVYAVRKIKPSKGGAFSYLTTVAINQMKKRINDERRQNYIKHKNFQSHFILGDIEGIGPDEHSDKVISDYEDTLRRKAEKTLTKAKKVSKIKSKGKKKKKK